MGRVQQWWRQATAADVKERLDAISADLPYELQSKMFDQLATVSVAGAGLAVTLIGSLLDDAPPKVWASVIFFAAAAILAVNGNTTLIDGIFRKKPILRRSKFYTLGTVSLIGLGIGSLSASINGATGRSPALKADVEVQRGEKGLSRGTR